jgi:hypothetical protein
MTRRWSSEMTTSTRLLPRDTDLRLPSNSANNQTMKTFVITISAMLLLAATTHAATLAFYDFNGSGTATVGSAVTDSVGGHHGTVTGGDLIYGSDPIVGNYLSFAADGPSLGGAGNRVVIPGHSDFLFGVTGTYTIETIFRMTQTGTGTNGVLLSKGADVSNPDSQLWLRHQGNGQLRGLIEGVDNTTEDTATSSGSPLVNDGLWHSVALVYDGTLATKRLDIFIDGILRGSDTSVGTLGVIGGDDNDPIIIGEFASLAANRSFAGDIAALRFSNTALTAAEFLAVPEPSTATLLAVSLAGVCFARSRRREEAEMAAKLNGSASSPRQLPR